jgi:hypothetical protein
MNGLSMALIRSACTAALLCALLIITSATASAQVGRGDPCNIDAECSGVDACLNGVCASNPRGCISTSDCGRYGQFSECTGEPGGRLCDFRECRADNDCRGDLVCTNNGRCVACENDADCSVPTPACQIASFVGDNRCVTCVSNVHCQAGQRCVNGNRCENICAAGTNWVRATSRSGRAPQNCDGCINPTAPPPACRSQRDCALGTLCAMAPGQRGGYCIPDCATPVRKSVPQEEFKRPVPFPQTQPQPQPMPRPQPKPGTVDPALEKGAIDTTTR